MERITDLFVVLVYCYCAFSYNASSRNYVGRAKGCGQYSSRSETSTLGIALRCSSCELTLPKTLKPVCSRSREE
jgi:hypothetical protein